MITLFLWGYIVKVSQDDFQKKKILGNKPILESDIHCLPARIVPRLGLINLTCSLPSNFWVAQEGYCPSETTAGIDREEKGKFLDQKEGRRRGKKTELFTRHGKLQVTAVERLQVIVRN